MSSSVVCPFCATKSGFVNVLVSHLFAAEIVSNVVVFFNAPRCYFPDFELFSLSDMIPRSLYQVNVIIPRICIKRVECCFPNSGDGKVQDDSQNHCDPKDNASPRRITTLFGKC